MPEKKPEQPSVLDQMADDAAPDEYPAGAPGLQPYLQIRPRSRRAQFKRKYADVAQLQETASAELKAKKITDKSPVHEQLRLDATLDDLYQLIDELMEMAAVDPQAYRKWADEVDDQTLMATFTVYQKRSQPGEASSSAT